MEKKKISFSAEGFEIIFFLAATIAIHIIASEVTEQHHAATYVGTAGLLNVRRELIRYLLLRLLRIFMPLLSVLFTGFWVHLFRHEQLRPSKERVLLGLVLCLLCYPSAVKHRTGFEMQCGINGYHGIRPMQAISLLADVQRDLSESAKPEEQTLRVETARENYPYIRHGRRYSSSHRINVYEFALTDARSDEPLAQIAPGDREALENICSYDEHSAAFFPHSGFVASFDGGGMDKVNDLETLFTLTYENNYVRRTVHPHESEMKNLTLIVERGGAPIGSILMKNTQEQWFSSGLHTRCWLELQYDGETVRVSNILEF